MRKRISTMFVALMLALMMLVGTAAAALAVPPSEDEQPNGNCGPIKNPPPGLVCVKGGGPQNRRRAGISHPGPSLCPYSAECVEGVFSEVRIHGVLGSSLPASSA